jgi:glutamate-1-semialdehyde 2,1-aminomutase
MELMRFANSGTEAIASSVRLARTFTGCSQIVLFEGHYHGWSDAVFHRYHAPLDELPRNGDGTVLPGTRGMNGAPHSALLLPWNNLDALEACLDRHAGEVAAVIMEPIMGNSGCIPPEPGFLQGVREATLKHNVLLIFDEVITGLRVAAGGASEYYRVTPDIIVISKALGGGYPVAAFGAARPIMDLIAQGELFHGGVYSGNPTCMAAADAVLDTILSGGADLYASLHAMGDRLANGLREVMGRLGVPHVVQSVGPIVSLFLTYGKIEKLTAYRDVRRHCDIEKYIVLQHAMQRRGVYFHPNQFETMFLSTAHTAADIDIVLERLEDGARSCLLH